MIIIYNIHFGEVAIFPILHIKGGDGDPGMSHELPPWHKYNW